MLSYLLAMEPDVKKKSGIFLIYKLFWAFGD
jgi:hypothetical protein